MKSFTDLKFETHPNAAFLGPAEQARAIFDNGYGVSVITGAIFYSSGVHENYELAVTDADTNLVYGHITNGDVLGYLSEDEVTELMHKVQALEPNSYGQDEPDLAMKFGTKEEES